MTSPRKDLSPGSDLTLLRLNKRAREESNLQPPGPQPGVLSIELRALANYAVLFYLINSYEAT